MKRHLRLDVKCQKAMVVGKLDAYWLTGRLSTLSLAAGSLLKQ